MTDIVLATLNARWSHASLGLRCLLANLGELAPRARIEELTLATPIDAALERLLAGSPRVIGLGIYIWNVERSTELVRALRARAPAVRIVLGGPEVSHETDAQEIVRLADHVVTGPGEIAFARLARQLLDGPRPLMKVLPGGEPDPSELVLPYALYTDEDLARRHLYVEASRGCPYACEFCLSSLDRTAWPFELGRVLDALADLHARGARRFRFVDRTFNLKASTGRAILDFMLARIEAAPGDPVFAHFELVPDHLPEALREAIPRFPAGTLQFEIGIQTWNPEVQRRIGRRQNDAKAEANLRWLRERTRAHLHVDLIAGLPGEDLASFGAGFDRLVSLRPHEIQVGVLKRLRGAPIARHAEAFGMRFEARAPYAVIETAHLAAGDLARIVRFARYWDLFGNSGRFPRTLPRLLGTKPFARFMAFSDWLWARTGATHRMSLEAQAEAAHAWLLGPGGTGDDATGTGAALAADYADSGARGRPAFMARGLPGGVRAAATRQDRHAAAAAGAPDPSLAAG
ncbi:MAG TPA: radical SAM protein [Burkholderiaceae bacterium]|nr:radical SAM protein [Burkholderiaceae bacterium]